MATTERSPGAKPERHVEDNYGVSTAEPGRGIVMGTEITVHDPARLLGHGLLPLPPDIQRHRLEIRAPELPVQLNHWQVHDPAQLAGEHRLPSPSSSEYDDALHEQCLPRASPTRHRTSAMVALHHRSGAQIAQTPLTPHADLGAQALGGRMQCSTCGGHEAAV
jgi:hypothetical protein